MSISKYESEIQATTRRRRHRQIDAEDYFDTQMGFMFAEEQANRNKKIAMGIVIGIIILGIIVWNSIN